MSHIKIGISNVWHYILIATIILIFSGERAYAQQEAYPVSWTTSVKQIEETRFQITFEAKIDSPWHMYDMGPYKDGPNATLFTFTPSEGITLIGKVKPVTESTKVFDNVFNMNIGYYVRKAVFTQDVELKVAKATLKANVEYMVCDDGSCLPPTDNDFSIVLTNPKAAVSTDQASQDTITEGVTKASEQNTEQNTDQITEESAAETDGSLWAVIIEAILWGFAALLTPCVFPMVPMTVSYFIKDQAGVVRGRFKALMYGVFIIGLYTIPIAAIIFITKLLGGDAVTADIFNWIATHWLPNVIFFLVFMIFAASFFGAFEITMPSSLVNKSDSKADKGGLGGLFFMALTLVLVSFSCTGPIVGSVLIKSTSGDVWEPVITMFAFSTAFALPFTIFALFPSMLKNLPKSGGWLGSVKVVLGFIEIALGLKFLSVADQTYHWGILDREVYLAIWIVVFALLGTYLLGKLRFAHDSEVKHVTVTRLGLAIVTFSFVVYLIPGMFGAPLKALSGYLPPLHTQDFIMGQNSSDQGIGTGGVNLSSGRGGFDSSSAINIDEKIKHSDFLHLPYSLNGFFDYSQAAAYAQKVNKPLFVDITGHGCVNCREMESKVWSDPRVLKLLRDDYVIVALYMDDKKELPESDWVTTPSGKVLKSLGRINSYFALSTFGVNAQPYYILVGKNGKQLAPPRGYDLNVESYVKFLQQGVESYYK